MAITTRSASLQQQENEQIQLWYGTTLLGWQHPRKVAYINRHSQLQDNCLYFWNHKDGIPEAAITQDFIFLLEDIYTEVRGEFKAQKLVIDVDLGEDGPIRLITGINTTCALSIVSSLCTLSPALLRSPLELKLRPGKSPGVVKAGLYVDKEWVDGRSLCRDEAGKQLPTSELLLEVQTLLKHSIGVEQLPHQLRKNMM